MIFEFEYISNKLTLFLDRCLIKYHQLLGRNDREITQCMYPGSSNWNKRPTILERSSADTSLRLWNIVRDI